MDLAKLVLSVVETLWPLAMDLWEAWGIQLLVAVSCFFQIILVTLGGRRRYSLNIYSKFTIWASYLLASYVATFTLGKLTVISVRDPESPDYNVGLKGLLAPLLLVHLANPDCISAYAVEDNRLGIRQVLNLIVTIVLVIWILIRCWDSSSAKWLYFPLFTSGVIKSVVTVLALKSVYDDSTSVDEVKRYYAASNRPAASGFLKLILMAYRRFEVMRPHQVDWLYHPKSIEDTWMSVDALKPEDAFTVTEIELGFVFDLLYTNTPILYTKIGIACKIISFSCLVSTLCGFSIIFRNAFLLDLYVTYTYALLIVTTIVELYQICILPFSHWAVVLISENKLVNGRVLACLVKICQKQRRWSDSIQQFDLVEYCRKGDYSRLVSFILQLVQLEEKLKRYRRSTHKTIPPVLKNIVLEKMNVLKEMNEWEMKKRFMPFTSRGVRTLEFFQPQLNQKTKDCIMKHSIRKEFDKSIIIWHIATGILLQSNPHSSGCSCKYRCVSESLSNYMMYLLALRPYMLSLTTSDITFEYVSSILKAFANPQSSSSSNSLMQIKTLPEDYKEEEIGKPITIITQDWRVLHDVKMLVKQLEEVENIKWELISSVWVEMLCFAARHCQVYHHARMLRKGGELITHVWLLLAHKTDKFPSEDFWSP